MKNPVTIFHTIEKTVFVEDITTEQFNIFMFQPFCFGNIPVEGMYYKTFPGKSQGKVFTDISGRSCDKNIQDRQGKQDLPARCINWS
jgi:hypothetical protein